MTPLSREEAINIARKYAKLKPESYYAEPFQPHEWVIDAIRVAFAIGYDECLGDIPV